jgi:hypothetical protein
MDSWMLDKILQLTKVWSSTREGSMLGTIHATCRPSPSRSMVPSYLYVAGVHKLLWLYVGTEKSNVDGNALEVCGRLITKANLTNAKGQILFTDNWYTSMNLAQHLWEKYWWTMCSTHTLMDKNLRQDHDVLFLKLSPRGALNMVPCAGSAAPHIIYTNWVHKQESW